MNRSMAFDSRQRFAAELWRLGAWLLCFFAGHAEAMLPVEFELTVEPSTLVVGEPLVIDMHVTNTGGTVLDLLSISSSIFTLAWYLEDTIEGCELYWISVADPVPPAPLGFGFSWRIPELQPGETATCRITYPQTLFPGRETISIRGSTRIDEERISEQLAEFTYTLLPPSGVPVLVETALEHSTVLVGEPLAVDVRVTNLGIEEVGPVSVLSSEFTLIGYDGHVLEDCAPGVTMQILPSQGGEFGVEWRIPGLQPGEAVTCRAIFPQTLQAGEELIPLSVVLDGVTWEDETGFAFRIQPLEEPPFTLEVSPRHSTVVLEEPLDFELRVTNTGRETLVGLILIGDPFFVADVSFPSLEGCEFFEDFQTEQYLFGWPPWQLDDLRQGTRLVWWVPKLVPGETASCHVTSANTWQTGEDSVSFSAWRGQTPWRDLVGLSYAVLSELPPPAPVPINSRTWLILAALMLLLFGAHRLRGLQPHP